MPAPPIRPTRQGDKLLVSGSHSKTAHCAAPLCGQTTRESKPFCPDHLMEAPYVAAIMGELKDRADELGRLRKLIEADAKKPWRTVDVLGGNCREILRHLSQLGGRTVERINREVFQTQELLLTENIVRALAAARMVKVGRTSRGSSVVELLPRGAALL